MRGHLLRDPVVGAILPLTIAAHELPYAIQQGWLDLNKYNKEHAVEVAGELVKLANRIRSAIKEQQT